MGKIQTYTALLAAALLLTAASCSTVRRLGNTPAAVPPYIRFTDGTVIHPQQVAEEVEFDGNRIVGDTVAYRRRDVAAFSDGQDNYVRLPRNKFGPQTASGKINVYSQDNAAKWGYPSHDASPRHLYIQQNGTYEVHPMNYHSLVKMIPPSAAAAGPLRGYKQGRTIIQLIIAGGAAAFIGGAVMSGNGINKNNDAAASTGVSMMFGGMGVMAGGFFAMPIHRLSLRRIVAMHNGVLKQ